MKTALIGYGKMGKTIEKILMERGHEVVARFDRSGINNEELQKADVAIEFTRPEAVFGNLAACFEHKIPVVCGTTGWLSKYDEAVKLCNENGSALLYASNFSLGVNLFFELNRQLARLMNNYPTYEVDLMEIHHTEKLDAPSGTAITLAEQLIDQLDRKQGWTMDQTTSNSQIKVEARREHNVPGTHSVNYSSDIDEIEIRHTAKSRDGFALGAVMAAEFLVGKSGIYEMKDVLNL